MTDFVLFLMSSRLWFNRLTIGDHRGYVFINIYDDERIYQLPLLKYIEYSPIAINMSRATHGRTHGRQTQNPLAAIATAN